MCHPAPPATAGLANGANAIITFSLEGVANKQNALTQAVIKQNDLLAGVVFEGAIYAEMWLVRSAGLYPLLLDSGFIQGGGPAHVVGMCGGVMFTVGDTLVCKLWNDSGAVFNYDCQYSTDHFEMDDVASCQSYTKLSTKSSGTWAYQVVILNDGATAGQHLVDYAFADGLIGFPQLAWVKNQDTAARNAGIYSGVITLALNAALAAAAVLPWPSGTTYAGVGINLLVPPETSFTTFEDAVAVSQDSLHGSLWQIKSRPPTVTITRPAGSTATVSVGWNEVR
jgi:hypothetical protein